MKKIICLSLLIMIILNLSACFSSDKILVEKTEFILDTICTIKIDGKDAEVAIEKAFERIYDISKSTSFYDDNSTVSVFNKAAANHPIQLDRHTADIIETALEISKASGGAFDPTIARVVELWDFKNENPMPPSFDVIKEKMSFVGYENLDYENSVKTLSKAQEEIKIDLGGAAKGYAADSVAELISSFDINYAIIDLGGNIKVIGENPKRDDGKWQVGIQTPFAEVGTYKEVIPVTDGKAVVTSGNYQRYFNYEGKLYHHILDPETGYPSENDFSGVTIVANSALIADCLSTACMVLNKEEAEELVKKYGADIYFSYK